jgi:hypothetical protein
MQTQQIATEAREAKECGRKEGPSIQIKTAATACLGGRSFSVREYFRLIHEESVPQAMVD